MFLAKTIRHKIKTFNPTIKLQHPSRGLCSKILSTNTTWDVQDSGYVSRDMVSILWNEMSHFDIKAQTDRRSKFRLWSKSSTTNHIRTSDMEFLWVLSDAHIHTVYVWGQIYMKRLQTATRSWIITITLQEEHEES